MSRTRSSPLDFEPSALVFDCGNTLLRLDPSREAICIDALVELGAPRPLEVVKEAYARVDFALRQRSSEQQGAENRTRFFTRFNRLLSLALGIESLGERFDRSLQAAFDLRRRWVAVTGAEDVLALLGERCALYVLANWDRALPERLSEAGLRDHFGMALASQELGAEKPDLRIFEAFCARTGVEPSRSLYIGDEYDADVVGSRNARFTPVLLDTERRFAGGVDCLRVENLSELPRLLGWDA